MKAIKTRDIPSWSQLYRELFAKYLCDVTLSEFNGTELLLRSEENRQTVQGLDMEFNLTPSSSDEFDDTMRRLAKVQNMR